MILRPAGFYRDLDRHGPLKGPVAFAVICGTVSAPLALLLAPLDPLAPDQQGLRGGLTSLAGNGPGAAVAIVVGVLVLSPLLAFLGLYVGAFFSHLFVMVFVRPRKGFEATLRV